MLSPVVLFASLALVQQVPAAPAASQPAPGAQTEASATPPAGAARPAAATAQVCRTEAVTGSAAARSRPTRIAPPAARCSVRCRVPGSRRRA